MPRLQLRVRSIRVRKKYGNASFRRRAVFVYCVTCQIYLIVPIYTGTAIINSKIIEQMASSLEYLPGWQRPVFSYDPSAIRNPVEIKNGGNIYISTGHSAYNCIYFIRELLKKYDLDLEEDFVYSARSTRKE